MHKCANKNFIEVPLSGKKGDGKNLVVDDFNFEKIKNYKWCLHSEGYAVRSCKVNGRFIISYLHRELINAPNGYDVDHINGNRLDNRQANLRLCRRKDNCRNSVARGGTSKYKGVHLRQGKWISQISCDKKRYCLGTFKTDYEAAVSYDRMAIKLFGQFAKTNILRAR
jgi:hypothetical protein